MPSVQRALDANEVTPQVAADLVLFLASGKADVLSGRCFSVDADVDEIVHGASDVQERDLYSLRMRMLD